MADSRFTSTALGAIRLAQENAARLGHCYVGSEHLLLGLACQEYSLAAQLLGEVGADSRTLRAAVVQLVGSGVPGPTLRQGLTPRCCRVIRRAAEECRRLGSPAVGAEHLLLGVILEPDSSGARLLGACEVDCEALRRAVYAALGGEEGISRPIRSREPPPPSGAAARHGSGSTAATQSCWTSSPAISPGWPPGACWTRWWAGTGRSTGSSRSSPAARRTTQP